MDVVFAGLDWASRVHALCVIDAKGAVRLQLDIEHSAAGLHGLMRSLRANGVQRIALERPSGLLVDALVEAGFEVVPVHPNAVKATRPRYRSHGGKSDASDAYLLATQEASGLYPALAALGDAQQFHAALAADDADVGRRQFAGSGLGLLFALIRPVASSLCDLIARRLPTDLKPGATPSAKPVEVGRLLRLIDRRKPEWLATIG